MFKFLRKYNKWILAVGGTLLMIVFLVPQAIQSLSQRAAVGGAVWATVGADDEEVSAADRNTCMRELDVLEQLARAGFQLGITDQPEHWYLLVREADQAGLTGGRAADQLNPEVLGTLAGIVAGNRNLDRTISKSLAVGRMLDLYQRAGKLSDKRLRAKAERLFHTVEGRAVTLEAEAAEAPREPTAAEILAQFEKYAEVAPGGKAANPDIDENEAALADNVAGFGYRLPDRFKIEWLRVERDDVRAMIEASDELNNIALIKHWKRNQESKTFPAVEPGADVPDRVRVDLLNELTTKKLDAIRKFMSDKLLASWRRLPSPDGYYVLPADWASHRVVLTDLAKALQSEFPGLALPTYQAVGDRWLELDDIGDLEGLENAGTDKYASRTTDVATLVGALKEFGGDPMILVQEGIAGPIMTDRLDNSLSVFRIIATDPSRRPTDVSEVRDRVVEDLKRQAAYEQLLAERDAIERTAKDDGLLALALEQGARVERLSVSLYSPSIAQFQLQNNMPLNPMPNSLPVIGQNEKASETIIDYALSLPADVPLSETPREKRVVTIPVPEKLALMIVEIDGQTPLDRDRFNLLVAGNALQTMVVSRELIDAKESLADVFSYDVMKTRHNFKVQVREDEVDPTSQPDAEAEDAATETANAG